MRALARYAPFLLLGPVTGPLAAYALICARRGRWVRVALCGLGIAGFWIGGPMLATAEVRYLIAHV